MRLESGMYMFHAVATDLFSNSSTAAQIAFYNAWLGVRLRLVPPGPGLVHVGMMN